MVELRDRSRLVLVLLLLATGAYTYNIAWGLPNGNETWSVDAIRPLTPLAVAHASLAQGWNSGWFYYKYPLGHFFVLGAAYAPYLGTLWLTGGISGVQTHYPYGFRDPETALYVMALVGRAVTVLLAVLTVWLLFRIGNRLWRSDAALWGAAAAAFLPPTVYYAHTTNLDIPQLFWMVLAWYAAVRMLDTLRRRDVLLFGVACGMALATRESAYAWLLGLAVLVLFVHLKGYRAGRRSLKTAVFRLAGGALAGVLTLVIASNGLYNPLGFWRRLLHMTGNLPPDVAERFVARAPLVFSRIVPDWAVLERMGGIILWSMGLPWFILSVAGIVVAFRRQPRATACILAPVLPYFFSVVGFPSLTVRYLLPATIGLVLFGGWAAAMLWQSGRLGKALTIGVACFTMVHGVGIDYLLSHDPRYQLEDWLRAHAPSGARVETYHKAPYRPRHVEGVEVYEPPFSEITIGGVEARRPEFVLVSLSNTKRVTQRYHKLHSAPIRPPENAAFLRALLSGELPYTTVAEFHVRWPLLPQQFIPALNPHLLLLRRSERRQSARSPGQPPGSWH